MPWVALGSLCLPKAWWSCGESHHPEQAIFGLEWEPARRPAEDGNLLAKRQVLENQIRTDPPERLEGLGQDAQHEVQGSHGSAYWPASGAHFKPGSCSALPGSSLQSHIETSMISRSTGFGEGQVEQVPLVAPTNPHNARYLATKRDRLGHDLPEDPVE